jgi:hypothetical protein
MKPSGSRLASRLHQRASMPARYVLRVLALAGAIVLASACEVSSTYPGKHSKAEAGNSSSSGSGGSAPSGSGGSAAALSPSEAAACDCGTVARGSEGPAQVSLECLRAAGFPLAETLGEALSLVGTIGQCDGLVEARPRIASGCGYTIVSYSGGYGGSAFAYEGPDQVLVGAVNTSDYARGPCLTLAYTTKMPAIEDCDDYVECDACGRTAPCSKADSSPDDDAGMP